MSKIAYSYQRFSHTDQASGDSLRRQQELVDRFVAENGLVLDTKLTDRGVSAYRGKNSREGALKTFLEGVESGLIPNDAWLICESLDRISRENIKEALSLFLSILNKGITIVTLSPAETKIYDKNASEIDIITSLLIFSRANNESKIKSERVKEAWKSKRKKLEEWSNSPDSTPGQPPFIATSSKPAWIDIYWENRKQRLGSFSFNEEKSALIRRIIDEYLSGIGFGQIAKRLNEEKVDPPVRAEYWHVSYLKKLLSYPALYGALVIKEMETYQSKTGRYVRRPVETGEVIENYYPALITKEDFIYIQSLRSERAEGKGRRGRNLSNLFTKLVVCGDCGGSMTYVNKGKSRGDGRYLVCSAGKSGAGCEYRSVRYAGLEESFFSVFKDISIAELLGDEAEELKKINDKRKELASLKAEIADKEKALDNIIEALGSGSAVDRVKKKVGQLDKEISEGAEKAKEMEMQLSQAATNQKHSEEEYKKLLKDIEDGDDTYKRRVSINNTLKKYLHLIAFYPKEKFSIIKTKSGKDISWDFAETEEDKASKAWSKHFDNDYSIWSHLIPPPEDY